MQKDKKGERAGKLLSRDPLQVNVYGFSNCRCNISVIIGLFSVTLQEKHYSFLQDRHCTIFARCLYVWLSYVEPVRSGIVPMTFQFAIPPSLAGEEVK
jgi:hypothetical protein